MERQFFGTDGIRGPANQEPLTPETALRLGQAAAEVLLRESSGNGWPLCIMGRDTRLSGGMLEAAMASGMASVGMDVHLAGVIPTPAVALLTRQFEATCGVVISASHNPFQDNGIKFFGADGYKLTDARELAIEQALLAMTRLPDERRAAAAKVGRIAALEDARERYIHSVLATVQSDAPILRGMKIALDCAHGASVETSPAILRHLGADLIVTGAEPSGLNINEACGATHGECISQLVRESGARAGIAHDGDADRLLLCDETGSVLDGDEILAIAATHLAKRGALTANTLVATVMSNFGLDETLEALGGAVIRCGVGDRYVIEEMRKRNLNLGGEQSGHLIFHDYATTGDGIVAAVQILQIMVMEDKPLSELRRCLQAFPQAKRNLRVARRVPLDELPGVQSLVAETESMLQGTGRVLLRYSGTEPLIRLLIEGRDAAFIESEADRIATEIQRCLGSSPSPS